MQQKDFWKETLAEFNRTHQALKAAISKLPGWVDQLRVTTTQELVEKIVAGGMKCFEDIKGQIDNGLESITEDVQQSLQADLREVGTVLTTVQRLASKWPDLLKMKSECISLVKAFDEKAAMSLLQAALEPFLGESYLNPSLEHEKDFVRCMTETEYVPNQEALSWIETAVGNVGVHLAAWASSTDEVTREDVSHNLVLYNALCKADRLLGSRGARDFRGTLLKQMQPMVHLREHMTLNMEASEDYIAFKSSPQAHNVELLLPKIVHLRSLMMRCKEGEFVFLSGLDTALVLK